MNGCILIKYKPKYGFSILFYFSLFETHYLTLAYLQTKENIIRIEDKIEPQHVMYNWLGL